MEQVNYTDARIGAQPANSSRPLPRFACPRDAWEHVTNYIPVPWPVLLAETDLQYLLAHGQPEPAELARRWGWSLARVLTLQAGGGR